MKKSGEIFLVTAVVLVPFVAAGVILNVWVLPALAPLLHVFGR